VKGLGQELVDRWPEVASIAAVGSTRQDYGDLGDKVASSVATSSAAAATAWDGGPGQQRERGAGILYLLINMWLRGIPLPLCTDEHLVLNCALC
jgi:hypothetical protein